jgi:methoxymalonate biosynthesis acyl carrier protein
MNAPVESANAHDTKTKLRDFIGSFIRNKEFTNSVNIFDSGFVNSMFVMQLILFVEKEFVLTVENEDLDLKNFASIDMLDDFIAKKKNRNGAGAV